MNYPFKKSQIISHKYFKPSTSVCVRTKVNRNKVCIKLNHSAFIRLIWGLFGIYLRLIMIIIGINLMFMIHAFSRITSTIRITPFIFFKTPTLFSRTHQLMTIATVLLINILLHYVRVEYPRRLTQLRLTKIPCRSILFQ